MRNLIETFGSQKAIAEAVGVTEAAVSRWFAEGRVPPRRALELERITEGSLKAIELHGEVTYESK